MTQILLKFSKMFSALLFVSLMAMPVFAEDAQNVDGEDDTVILNDVKYVIDREAKTAALINGQLVSDEFTIPEWFAFEGVTYTVSAINASAFRDNTGMKTVVIPNTVTTISQRAFQNCSALVSLTIPNSVTEISNMVFQDCTSLTSIVLSADLTSL